MSTDETTDLGPIGRAAFDAAVPKNGKVIPPARAGSPAEQRWAEIEKLLRDMFETDLASIRSKALQYGSSDLKIMGKAMESLIPDGSLLDSQSREAAGLEMAVGFYAVGKSARLYGAWERGEQPDEDCWYDNEVYSKMARVIRLTGRWM